MIGSLLPSAGTILLGKFDVGLVSRMLPLFPYLRAASMADTQGLLSSTALAPALPITPVATIWPDLTIVCLLSLLGLTLSAMVLSRVSSETISMMFSSLG